ncbi:23S rRNA (adenine(2030)-N(6))-methyltransferase RlmJ [Paracoccaceae bacterium GXU_MW_L88]
MLSYQHAYHAGGPADLHKHLALAELLSLLTRKPRGISYFETHSGRGLYDLSADETAKTGEAAEGILAHSPKTGAFADALARLRADKGETAYFGSPLLAQLLLREQDVLRLMELHPAEIKALRRTITGAEIHHRDGYEGVLALSPPKPRKGLVLVDPSYEVKSEYAEAADFTRKLIKKWPEAVVLIWYPILPAARHQDLLDGLKPLRPHVDEVAFDLKGGAGMTGSGLALVNAPYGADDALAAAFKQGQPLLRRP